jgi:membrane dipeptidase
MRRILHTVLVTVALAAPLAAQVPDSSYIRRALRLHRQVPMLDGHDDLPWEIRRTFGGSLDSARLAEGQPRLMTDIPRLRAGAVGGMFWSIWGPTTLAQQLGPQFVLEQIDIVRRMEQRWPQVFMPARTADDIVRAHRSGRVASLIGVEGGDALRSSLPVLRQWYDLGVRYLTLTWNATLPWVDAAADSARHDGLSPFGVQLIGEMNRLGMLVDLSHVSVATMEDVLDVAAAPVIFSHSSARALTEHRRNVPDAILRRVAQNGGLVMVNFNCGFIDSAYAGYETALSQAMTDARQSATDTASYRVALEAWRAAHAPPPRPTVRTAADHIEHIARMAGADHVGYGSDFDGVDCAPAGLEDVAMFPNLTAELLRRGWSDADAKKAMGQNLLRVLRQNEAVARRLQRERGPSTATLAMDSTGVTR